MLNITSEEIIEINKYNKSFYTNPDQRNILKEKNLEQDEDEKKIIKTQSVCSIPKIKHLQEHLANLDSEEMRILVRKQFFNPNVMKHVTCLTESFVYTPSHGPESISSNERLKYWIRDLKQIGSESISGYAMSGSLDNNDNFFVVKAPRDPNNNDLLHEYFVGTYGTNLMRSKIPNFAYIFGSFACSPPIIDQKTKKVESWCNNEKVKVSYVLYENIFPSIDLDGVIREKSAYEWLNQYMQILYSLNQAVNDIGFTHYDLHMENVLSRDIGRTQPFSIQYNTENGIEFLETDRIATIIDYGRSHIIYKGKHYGFFGETIGTNHDKVNPFHDAYKLLMWSMYMAKYYGNLELLEIGRIIFMFFNRIESLDDAVDKQIDTRYYIPYTPELENMNLFDLTAFIRKNIKVDFLTQIPNSEVLGCQDMVCISDKGIDNKTGTFGEIKPHDIFTFYDAYHILHDNRNWEEASNLVNNFDYVTNMVQFQDNLSRTIDTLFDDLENLQIVVLSNSPINVIFNDEYLNHYKQYISDVAQIYDTLQSVILYKSIGDYVSTIYGDENALKYFIEENEDILKATEFMTEIDQSIVKDNEWLYELSQKPEVKKILKENSKFEWYYDAFLNYNYMLGYK